MFNLSYRGLQFSVIDPKDGRPFPMEDMTGGAQKGVIQVKMPSNVDFAVQITVDPSNTEYNFFKCMMKTGGTIITTRKGYFRKQIIRGHEGTNFGFHFVSASKADRRAQGDHASYDQTTLDMYLFPIKITDKRCPPDADGVEGGMDAYKVLTQGSGDGPPVSGGLICGAKLPKDIETPVYTPPKWETWRDEWQGENLYLEPSYFNVKLQLVSTETDEEKDARNGLAYAQVMTVKRQKEASVRIRHLKSRVAGLRQQEALKVDELKRTREQIESMKSRQRLLLQEHNRLSEERESVEQELVDLRSTFDSVGLGDPPTEKPISSFLVSFEKDNRSSWMQ